MVGDIELLAIPKYAVKESNYSLFPETINLLEEEIARLIEANYLYLRPKSDGTVADGHKVKLLKHVELEIPIDLFMTSEISWFSGLVCRTGGKLSNEQIAGIAKAKGWQWKMGGPGFQNRTTGEWVIAKSEEDIFKFVGLPYLPPNQRL